MIRVKRSLDLPISGTPEQRIEAARPICSMALTGFSYHGIEPAMAVQVGDQMKLGQVLFTDKKNLSASHTTPGTGMISAIHRDEKRVLQLVIINLDGGEQLEFVRYLADQLATLNAERVRDNLLQPGPRTALRTRPLSKVPNPESSPSLIFVAATDTQPLAADLQMVIAKQDKVSQTGLTMFGHPVWVFLCKAEGVSLPGETLSGVTVQTFAGPYPADPPGTRIHFLGPVDTGKNVWNLSYQNVVAIGRLFTIGRLWAERMTALVSPVVEEPRLICTWLNTNLDELTVGQLQPGNNRLISDFVLGGRTAHGTYTYLRCYHLQLSCLKEDNQCKFLHYLRAGMEKHLLLNVFISRLLGGKCFAFTTSTNDSPRVIVSVGNYKAAMLLDILPTQLLCCLIVGSTEMAQKLGALELDGGDLVLCSYVCAGKCEYSPILRDSLAHVEQRG